MVKVSLSVVFVVLAISAVPAQAVYWGGGDGDWNVPSNWVGGLLPTAADPAQNYLGGNQIVSGPASCAVFETGWPGYPAGKLTIQPGGSLQVGQYGVFGYYGGANWVEVVVDGAFSTGTNLNIPGNGTVVQNPGSSVTVGSFVYFGSHGDATYTMNGGTFNVPGGFLMGNQQGNATVNRLDVFGGTMSVGVKGVGGYLAMGVGPNESEINLYGGLVEANFALALSWAGTASGNINIEGGILQIAGNHTSAVPTWEAAGDMVAYGGTGNLVYDYGVTRSGYTTITAVVPEPATVSLLTLGGLLLKRRT